MSRTRRALSILLCMALAVPALACLPAVEEVSAYSVHSAGQNMIADPARDLIYYANLDGTEVQFIDSETSAVLSTVEVGTYPTSLDLSSDGSTLYVAVSGTNSIVAIGVDSRTVVDSFALSFSPLSVRVSSGGLMFISGATTYDGEIRVIKMSTLQQIDSEIPSNSWFALELSPAEDMLLATSIGGSPVKIYKYSVGKNGLTFQDVDNHDLGGNFHQEAVDWTNGKIYLSSGAPYGLEIVSLSTLDRIGFLSTGYYGGGAALMPDASMVFALDFDYYDSRVFAFDTATGNQLRNLVVPQGDGWLAVSGDGRSLFVQSPLMRISLVPEIRPYFPENGTEFAYTPGHVDATVWTGIPESTISSLSMTLNGLDLQTNLFGETLRGYVGQSLSDGIYTVTATMVHSTGTETTSWDFTVDRTSTASRRPSLTPSSPVPGTTLNPWPLAIVATIDYGVPAVEISNSYCWLDETTYLPTTIDGGSLMASASSLAPGIHMIMMWFSWGPELADANWSFTVQDLPRVEPFFPGNLSTLSEPPSFIAANIYTGSPSVNITYAQISLNNVDIPTAYNPIDHTAVAELDVEIPDGHYIVSCMIGWDGGNAMAGWSFDVAAGSQIDLVLYDHPGGFAIPVPRDWDVEEYADVSGTVFDMLVSGPVYGGFMSNVIIDSEEDPYAEETQEYLETAMQDTLDQLEADGVNFTLYEGPEYLGVSNHSAVVFAIEWYNPWIMQKIAIVVSEKHQMDWAIIFSVALSNYAQLDPVFETMIAGFTITLDESADALDWPYAMLFYAAIGGIAALVAVLALRSVKSKKAVPPPGPFAVSAAQGVMTASPTGFCSVCGATQPLGNIACTKCGRSLPNPPFGMQKPPQGR